jgi:flagellar protein FlbD
MVFPTRGTHLSGAGDDLTSHREDGTSRGIENGLAMIQLTRLTGAPVVLNADHLDRIDSVPDTVLTMLDGRKYVVTETAQQVIDQVVSFRAAIVVAADDLQREPAPTAPVLRLVTSAQER